MRSLIVALVVAALLGSPLLYAEGEGSMVRVYLEYIGVPHETLTALMAGDLGKKDAALHKHLRELVKKKGARILETNILTLQSGHRSNMASLMEFIYPTEYDPSGGIGFVPPPDDGLIDFPTLRPGEVTAFETRNLGVTLEVEAIVSANEKFVEVSISSEIVDLLGLKAWQEYKDRWGESNLSMPVMESLRLDTDLVFADGVFATVGLLSAQKAKRGFDPKEKILLFMKADIISAGPVE